MRFLANMNISPLTVERLRGQGWDILRVSEILPVSTPDNLVLEVARTEGRVLVSQDLDFSKILALEEQTSPSLITIRMTICDPGSIAERLLRVLPVVREKLASGCAITVDDHKIRMRPLPIKPSNGAD